jgi:hypothetical protein
LNIRAAGDPVRLQALVEGAVSEIPGTVEWGSLQCFRPSPPVPERRA